MSIVFLVFALYLNQMSCPTIFPTSHLMTKRMRNQTRFRYILVPYGHVLVPPCVILRICGLLIFRDLFLFIHTSVNFSFFFVLLLLLVISSFGRLLSKILIDIEDIHLFPESSSLYHYDAIILPILSWPCLSREISRSFWALIFVRVRSKSQFTIGFFKSSSVEDSFKQKIYNAKLHPPDHDIIEELVERIIHSVPE